MTVCLPDANVAQTWFWLTGAIAFAVAVVSGITTVLKNVAELKGLKWAPARDAYEHFLDLAVANPEFTEGYWSDPARTLMEKNKYRWFMARFLWAAEQALIKVPEHPEEWERVVRVMLREHVDFIASPETADEVECYYGPLKDLIDQVKRDARAGLSKSPAS